MVCELTDAEQRLQLHLLNDYEKAGNLTPKTAARYRQDLVQRGISIFGRGMDGPNASDCVQRWEETNLALARDSLRFSNVRAADAEARRLQRRLLRGDTAAAFVRLGPSPERRP